MMTSANLDTTNKLTYNEENAAKQAELKRVTDQEIAEHLARTSVLCPPYQINNMCFIFALFWQAWTSLL